MSTTPQNTPHSKLNDDEYVDLNNLLTNYLVDEYQIDPQQAVVDTALFLEMLHDKGYSIDKIDHDSSRGHSTAST